MRVAVIKNGLVANIIDVADLATVFRVQVEQLVPGYVPPEAELDEEGKPLPLPPPPTERVWVLPEGITVPELVASETAQIGDSYADGVFVFSPPAPAPVVVPQSLNPLEMRDALDHFGWRDEVEALIEQAPRAMQNAWYYSLHYRRNDPRLMAVASALHKTPEQLDELFIYGKALP